MLLYSRTTLTPEQPNLTADGGARSAAVHANRFLAKQKAVTQPIKYLLMSSNTVNDFKKQRIVSKIGDQWLAAAKTSNVLSTILPYNYHYSVSPQRSPTMNSTVLQAEKPNTSSMSEFVIEFEEMTDGCYRPGQTITGAVVVSVSASSAAIEIISLKIRFCGSARVKCKAKAIDPKHELIYMDEEIDLLESKGQQQVESNEEQLFPFEKKLRSEENEIKTVNAVRGITIVENFDLNLLPCTQYFEPNQHNLVRKFGLFSCTGGHIRLNFSICRSAFVCGENIIIEGRIENKTDRRVDKVAAVLQQVIVVYGDSNQSKDNETNLLDVTDIHEDNLALFIDEGAAVRIERNFALPPLPPSTFALDGTEPNARTASPTDLNGDAATRRRRISLNMPRLSYSSTKSSPTSNQRGGRFLKVLYQMSVRVKTGGVEVMEINVPIVIGSIPHKDNQKPDMMKKNGVGHHLLPQSAPGEYGDQASKSIMYLQNRKERPVPLAAPSEVYICGRTQLSFTNKYPFFVDLPTSSKQSRKVSMLANAMRVEANIRQQMDSNGSVHSSRTAESPPANNTEPTSKPKSIDCYVNEDNTVTVQSPPQTAQSGHGFRSRIDRPCRHNHGAAGGLPPVEILINDSRNHRNNHIEHPRENQGCNPEEIKQDLNE
ncbi:ARRestin Domain protein [Ditylenchus destructor]|uniref:ARRestin Domain protein n=1 Tax=Ditylenchus destructor TaxID=166010 RepID=A0AAD4N217_9BILA|nr:ARRestin Domain protein [Ditylenchus destructor]